MGRDREQRFRQLSDAFDIEVLQILRCQNNSRLLLAHTLHEISDILNRSQIGQEQIQLINRGGSVPLGQQLVAHEGKYIEQQGVLDILTGLQQSLDAKYNKAVGSHIGVAVEEFTLSTHTHGVEPQQNFLQQFLWVELIFGFVISPELIIYESVKVR